MIILDNIDPVLLQQITTIATVIIAILAFVVSIWQINVQRRHNKLSVKPLITFEELKTNTERGFGIFIRNDGFGPAIIKEFKIYVDDIQIISDYSTLWEKAAIKLDIAHKFVIFHTCEPETAISASSRLPIFTIEKPVNEDEENLFKKAISRLNIEIVYESIYKQKDKSRLNEA